jgi:tetratricopeptide (TPR) repeat protein
MVMKNKLSLILALLIMFTTNTFSQDKPIQPTYKDCMKLINYGEYHKAVKCTQVLKNDRPSWFYPVYLEAKAYRGLKNDDKAIELLRESIDLAGTDDEYFPIFYEMAHLYYVRWENKSDSDDAYKWCTQAKSVAYKKQYQKKTYSLCGKIAYKKEDWRIAERNLEKAFELDKNNSAITELYIKTLSKLSKKEKVLSVLSKASKNEVTYGMFAEIQIQEKKYIIVSMH